MQTILENLKSNLIGKEVSVFCNKTPMGVGTHSFITINPKAELDNFIIKDVVFNESVFLYQAVFENNKSAVLKSH